MTINAFFVNQDCENINFDIFSSCWQQKQRNVIYHCLVISRLAVCKSLLNLHMARIMSNIMVVSDILLVFKIPKIFSKIDLLMLIEISLNQCLAQ